MHRVHPFVALWERHFAIDSAYSQLWENVSWSPYGEFNIMKEYEDWPSAVYGKYTKSGEKR